MTEAKPFGVDQADFRFSIPQAQAPRPANISSAELIALPDELIVQIAISCDAVPALRLSSTCQKIRAAIYDSLVFRSILGESQKYEWKRDSLDLNAIQTVAQKSPALWARYAVADQKAWNFALKEAPLDIPNDFLHWLPELFIVKHPYMYDQSWSHCRPNAQSAPLRQLFCVVMALLASDDYMFNLHQVMHSQDRPILYEGLDARTFLWALCEIIMFTRSSMRTRQQAWPYNSAAIVPDIALPRASQIPLQHHLVLPFAKPQNFDKWYTKHNESIFTSPDYFTRGTWGGYYTYMGQSMDPPMININFREVPTPHYRPDKLRLRAEGCRDGVGPFNLTGGFTHSDRDANGNGRGEVEFTAMKEYTNNGTAWLWDLRLTPFGLVGFWGPHEGHGPGHVHHNARIRRLGMVWLWKEEWTAPTA